jgi:hypothetical protein
LAAGGALIVILCGALGAVIANRSPRPEALLAVAHLVPVGMVVTAADLSTVSIAPVPGLEAIPLQDASQVIGHRATEALEPGSLLVPGDLASGQGLPAGTALVGTSLAVDQLPSGLATGEPVLVVLSGTAGEGSVTGSTPSSPATSASGSSVPSPTGPPGSVLTKATVVSISAPASSSATGASGSAYVATLDVPQVAAAAVAAASAAGDVSLAEIGKSDNPRESR